MRNLVLVRHLRGLGKWCLYVKHIVCVKLSSVTSHIEEAFTRLEISIGHEVIFSLLLFVAASSVLVIFSWEDYSNAQFRQGLRLAFHGTLIDVIFIGAFLLCINRVYQNKRSIAFCKKIIDDLRHSRDSIAISLVYTNMKQLVEMRVEGIDLRYCNLDSIHLNQARLVKSECYKSSMVKCEIVDSNISMSNFELSILSGGKIRKVEAINCNFDKVKFDSVVISGSNFAKSSFYKTEFYNATLDSVDFSGCDFNEVQFDKAIIKNCVFTDCRNLNPQMLFTAKSLSKSIFEKNTADVISKCCSHLLRDDNN